MNTIFEIVLLASAVFALIASFGIQNKSEPVQETDQKTTYLITSIVLFIVLAIHITVTK